MTTALDTGYVHRTALETGCTAACARPVLANAQPPLELPRCAGCGTALTYLAEPPRWVCANPSCPFPTVLPVPRHEGDRTMSTTTTTQTLSREETIAALKEMCDRRVWIDATPLVADGTLTYDPAKEAYGEPYFSLCETDAGMCLMEHEVQGGYWLVGLLGNGDSHLYVRTFRSEFSIDPQDA
jgi:hypothetical protein